MTPPGRTEITHARVLRMALPIVLSNATVPLLGAVDTAVVGQLGLAAPIGAVGLGAVVLATVYWIFSFLRMGTSGLAAQAHGAGDEAERSAILLRALIIGFGAGLCFILAQAPLVWATFKVAPASAEVEALTRQYLAIRLWGAPATIGLFAVTGWLVALERTRGILLLQLWMNGLNIGLDLWFVIGLGWGVPGVAAATLIAEWSGLALGLWLCRDAFGPVLRRAWARVGDRAALARMMLVNRDIMVRSVLLQASFTTFVFLGAGFGDVTLAANQVLLQFLEISAYALDGFAFAAEALVGQAVGARSVAGVRRSSVMLGQWGAGGALFLALVFALAGPQIIDLITTSPEVRAEARQLLPWLVVAPLIGVASWILDGVFIGATQTREMMRAMLISVPIYGAALLLLVPLMGNHGLWASLMVLNATRGVTMLLAYPKVERQAAV
ncbi:MATE family efflux transporter [Cereibacter changlensis JA139]|uniref:MATE family efflux transporter n=2 Tax=Cereibacter changlensis TaxID=402884 RepID=A0A2T4JWA2_9RHOB|nr:MATE family efflux transporter [Cereibacter changlensis]PTE22191.1 MATE family efflux transporter [Cereibacter changlensis JA139]PZX50356.1 MATE family multidrug resistance protein [Cereibacter changlensis]